MKSQFNIDKIASQLKPIRFFDRPEFLFLTFVGFLIFTFIYRSISHGLIDQMKSPVDFLQVVTFFLANTFIIRTIYLSLKPDSALYLMNSKFDFKIGISLFAIWLSIVVAKSYSTMGYFMRVPNVTDQMCLTEILKANVFSSLISVFIFRKIRPPRTWSLLTLLCVATLTLNSLVINILCADVTLIHRVYGHLTSILVQVIIIVPLSFLFVKRS